MTSILDLPREIIGYIGNFLTFEERYNVNIVHRKFGNIHDNFKYHNWTCDTLEKIQSLKYKFEKLRERKPFIECLDIKIMNYSIGNELSEEEKRNIQDNIIYVYQNVKELYFIIVIYNKNNVSFFQYILECISKCHKKCNVHLYLRIGIHINCIDEKMINIAQNYFSNIKIDNIVIYGELENPDNQNYIGRFIDILSNTRVKKIKFPFCANMFPVLSSSNTEYTVFINRNILRLQNFNNHPSLENPNLWNYIIKNVTIIEWNMAIRSNIFFLHYIQDIKKCEKIKKLIIISGFTDYIDIIKDSEYIETFLSLIHEKNISLDFLENSITHPSIAHFIYIIYKTRSIYSKEKNHFTITYVSNNVKYISYLLCIKLFLNDKNIKINDIFDDNTKDNTIRYELMKNKSRQELLYDYNYYWNKIDDEKLKIYWIL